MDLTARPAKSSRFVIWYGRPRTEETEERDLLLGRLGFPDLSALHGVPGDGIHPDLRDDAAFFLDYTGLGKLCVAVRHDPDARIASSREILDKSVVTLELSVRASNCLRHAGIETIAELVRWSPDQILELPSAGRKTRDEIIEALLRKGISSPSLTAPFLTGSKKSIDPNSKLTGSEFRLETLLSTAEAGFDELLRHRLKLIGIRSLADLAQQEASWIRATADLEPTALVDLASGLRNRGLQWGMKLPTWQCDHYAELEDAFAPEILETIRIGLVPVVCAEEPATVNVADSLTEELELLFPKKTDPRDRTIVRAYFGLGGDLPLTLEETARQFDLTRERVRQIAKPFDRALDEIGQHLPWLEEALAILAALTPCSAEEAETVLQTRGIVSTPIRLEGLLKIAERASIQHSFVLEGQRRLLLDQAMTDTVRKAISYAAQMVSHWGIATKDEVLEYISCDPLSRLAESIWEVIPEIAWLDKGAKFLWMPTGRNAIANRLVNILGVTPVLDLHDAYEGIFRDGRVNRDRVPFELLAAFCEQYPWCLVTEGKVSATAELPRTDESSHDDIIVGFLRETSGIGWRDDLWRRAQSVGISKPSFDRLLSDSNVLVRHAGSLYGIIGTSAPNALPNHAEVEITEESVEEETVDAPVWTMAHSESGLLAGCDPVAPLFPFKVLALISAKAASFDGLWSLAELALSASDRKMLRLWGESGNWDFRRDGRKEITVGGVRMGGRHAISLTFLLFCSEVARDDAIEGEVWPAISFALGDSLRRSLFAQPSVPKPILRDSTEEVCRNLRLRHVFGREGEQSWMRTVFLQFGFTRRGMKSLDRWLSARECVPVAVEDLLDPSRGLLSQSFTSMWQTLLEVRWRTIDLPKADASLEGNPWVLPECRVDLLNQALARRQRENVETDSDPEAGYRLLLDKTMRLGNEPSFEFHLNPAPPAWCNGERYTLEVGDRRLPISRKDDHWQFDQTPTLIIPMDEPCVEIALTQRRVSVMQEKLHLDLRPIGDFAFYNLRSGTELTPDEQSTRTSAAIAILCKSEISVQPEPPEYIAVFGGHWKLMLFQHGLPQDLIVVDHQGVQWKIIGDKDGSKANSVSNIKVSIGNGWWGGEVQVRVVCPPERNLRARNLIVSGQNVELALLRHNEFVGRIRLAPELEGRTSASVFCENAGWITRFSVAIDLPPFAGVALENENGWIVLDGTADIDLRSMRGRKLKVRPPLHDGAKKDFREWALLEGERLVARPRQNSEELRGLEALGEPLSLAYGPYNNQERWHQLARSVVDTGNIHGLSKQSSQNWTINLSQPIGLGSDHAVWIWMFRDRSPQKLDNTSWTEVEGEIKCTTSPGETLGFAVSYRGVWLGSKWVDGSWDIIRRWVNNSPDWRQSAAWLRWWRAPVRHTELCGEIEMRVRREPVSTICGWLLDEPDGESARQSEGQEEPWQLMTRSFLWDWQPNSTESVEILKHFDVWTGDADSDMRCDNYEVLLSTNPMLLVQVAKNGAEVLYENATKRDLAALLRCLRNRILEPQAGVRWEDAYHEACLAASTDLNVDEQFLLKSVVGDARRYVRGELADSRNLKLALGSLLLRQIVAARLLEEVAEEWTKR